MNFLNYDLKLQLVDYLYNNNIIAWLRLFLINEDFYLAYLYNLRKNMHILTANEINIMNDYLVKLSIDINQALADAAGNDHLVVVKYLTGKGADITSAKVFGSAVVKGKLKVLKYLFEYNKGLDQDKKSFLVRYAAANGHLPVVKYLVKNGANISTSKYNPLTPAAANGHLPVVKYLVKQGANVQTTSNIRELTNLPLTQAAKNGHGNVVQYLASQGADVSVLTSLQRAKYGVRQYLK